MLFMYLYANNKTSLTLMPSLNRSLPNLEVLGESSLMSILRWNFKPNMDKTISSSNRGLIALVGSNHSDGTLN